MAIVYLLIKYDKRTHYYAMFQVSGFSFFILFFIDVVDVVVVVSYTDQTLGDTVWV